MKKKNWILVALILAFLMIFVVYRQYDAMHTDTEAPQITIENTQLLLSVQDEKNVLLQGVTATDKQDGDVTDRVLIESMELLDDTGRMEICYAAVDSSGNVSKASREVRYTDYVSPRFSLSEPLIYGEYESFDIMSDVFATDVLDGDIQHRIHATSLTYESISNVGCHDVYFQVTNSLGDMSDITIPVEVVKSGTYNADLTLTDYLIYLSVDDNFKAENYLKTFVYKTEETSLRSGVPENYSLNIGGAVNTKVPGVYTVEYRVTYTMRSTVNPEYDQEYTGYSKLIVLVEG